MMLERVHARLKIVLIVLSKNLTMVSLYSIYISSSFALILSKVEGSSFTSSVLSALEASI